MGTYAERRKHVRALLHDALDALQIKADGAGLDDWGGVVPRWRDLEERLTGMKERLDRAVSLDDRQDVGRRAKEIVIDAVALAFDESMVPDGEDAPKGADAKARFDLIVASKAGGKTHAELRGLMRAAWELAQKLTHGEGLDHVDAFAGAQAVILLVRTLGKMTSAEAA